MILDPEHDSQIWRCRFMMIHDDLCRFGVLVILFV